MHNKVDHLIQYLYYGGLEAAENDFISPQDKINNICDEI